MNREALSDKNCYLQVIYLKGWVSLLCTYFVLTSVQAVIQNDVLIYLHKQIFIMLTIYINLASVL